MEEAKNEVPERHPVVFSKNSPLFGLILLYLSLKNLLY